MCRCILRIILAYIMSRHFDREWFSGQGGASESFKLIDVLVRCAGQIGLLKSESRMADGLYH